MSPPTASTSTTSLIDKQQFPELQRSSSLPVKTNKDEKQSSWREKFRAREEPPVAVKEKWRDATLSEEERWKEWHKQKDEERKAGMTTTYATDVYRSKGGWASWMGVVGGS